MSKQNYLKAFHVTRNDSAERWSQFNPTLMKGEEGIENETLRRKIGDGITPWNDLPYADAAIYSGIEDEKQRAMAAEAEEKNRAEAAEQALSDRLDSANTDLTKITNLLKNGATLDDAKSALAEFGEGYRDLYEVAQTLYTFLKLEDPNDVINRWQEVESFLQGITDTDTLTNLLTQLELKITTAYSEAVRVEKERAEAAEQALSGRVDKLEEYVNDGELEVKINEVIDGRFADDVYVLDGGNAQGYSVE